MARHYFCPLAPPAQILCEDVVMTNGVVLAYHAVGSCASEDDRHHLFVTPSTFERQMAFLAERRRVVTLEDALDDGPPGRVAITFDDAYRNVAEVASPILERYGFPATVFAPTGFLDEANTWDDPSPCDLSIASARELAALTRRDVTIESHGHGHIDMAASPTADIVADLATSRALIEDITGRAPRFLAYPFGRSSGDSRAAAEAAGFRAAFTIDRKGEGRFASERVPVNEMDGNKLFALKTSGRYLVLRHSPWANGTYRAVKPIVRRMMKRN